MGSTKAPVKRAPGRPRGGQPAASADDLLAAAEHLIRQNGPETTLMQVAAEAGVSKPILYRQVGDKDALVRALAERMVDRIAADIAQATGQAETAEDAIAAMVAAYLGAIRSDRSIYLYVTASGGSSDRVADALHLADRAVQPMAEGFAQLRASTGADPSVAETWAYAVVGMLHYVALSWIRDPSQDLDTLATHTTQLLWSGLNGPA